MQIEKPPEGVVDLRLGEIDFTPQFLCRDIGSLCGVRINSSQ